MSIFRNRVTKRERAVIGQFARNPRNPKVHPDVQMERLQAILERYGMVGEIYLWRSERNEGAWTIFDGNGRLKLEPEAEWDVAYTDLTDAEVDELVMFYDPIVALAEADQQVLAELLQAATVTDERLTAMLAEQAEGAGLFFEGDGLGETGNQGTIEDLELEDSGDVSGLVAPFPYFGGKSRVAGRIWKRFGQVKNYVEPFCGSAAVLLACPFEVNIVTLNDADGFVANFWRAVAYAPDEVARWVDWPVNENDLFARHVWLMKQQGDLIRQLETDPEWYDSKVAGWWCWGACAWLGTGWCSGEGPWSVEDGIVVNLKDEVRQLPHLGNAGRGVNRQLPHLGNAGRGVNRKLPELWGRGGERRALGEGFEGSTREAISTHLIEYMNALADALRRPRVVCGDWARVITPSVTFRHGLTAVLFDPPYGEGEMEYSSGGNQDKGVALAVWEWAVENGGNPDLRIAVCGYDDGRSTPPGWTAMRWKARKGYQVSTENSEREVVWFSPHCLHPSD